MTRRRHENFKTTNHGVVLGSSASPGESSGPAAFNMMQSLAGGGVTAKVTYLTPKSADDPRFQVVLDTHSVNLDGYDFKTVAVLRDDNEKNHAPVAAENKGSGHHREVTLSFPKFARNSKRIELMIRDIAGVKERTFVWNLE